MTPVCGKVTRRVKLNKGFQYNSVWQVKPVNEKLFLSLTRLKMLLQVSGDMI